MQIYQYTSNLSSPLVGASVEQGQSSSWNQPEGFRASFPCPLMIIPFLRNIMYRFHFITTALLPYVHLWSSLGIASGTGYRRSLSGPSIGHSTDIVCKDGAILSIITINSRFCAKFGPDQCETESMRGHSIFGQRHSLSDSYVASKLGWGQLQNVLIRLSQHKSCSLMQ
jgi:hypothetical protein